MSNNGLVEGKNGHVIRKLFGYTHIPQCWAKTLNDFHRLHTNPYHNYHRPCLFSETLTDPRGKQRKRYPYRLSMTPYDKLKSLSQAWTKAGSNLGKRASAPIEFRLSFNSLGCKSLHSQELSSRRGAATTRDG